MFYWNHRGTYLVLTDAEETALVRELADTPSDVIGYNILPKTRRKYEKRIFAYLKHLRRADPEGFRRKYVFRSCYGISAQQLFPTFLDAYGRATRIATFGSWGGDPLFDDALEGIIHGGVDNVYHVTLLTRSRWLPRGLRCAGRISFPRESIEKLVGEVGNFTLITDSFSIRFGRDFIRMTVRRA